MYINPSTNVRLLSDVKLDLDHTHTINFHEQPVDQATYFINKTKFNLTNYSYQRHTKDSIKVGILADKLYNCDYMMFQNSAYGNKWFYAFITNIEYVNDTTSIVYYKIDVIQTWYFETVFEPCYIERTHARTDNIGDNIQPEPVALGEYKFANDYFPIAGTDANTGEPKPFIDMSVVILASEYKNGNHAKGTLIDGVYSGYTVYVYDIPVNGNVDELNDFLFNHYINEGKSEAILSIYMAPTCILRAHRSTVPGTDKPEVVSLGSNNKSRTISQTFSKLTDNETLDGYKPRNNKMYTYPYNYFHIDNADGEELALRYEFFDNLTPVVHISGTGSLPVTVVLRPTKYKNVQGICYTESLTLRNYPLCSWNVDSFQAWASKETTPMIIQGATGVASTLALSSMHLNTAGTMSLVHSVANILTQTYRASKEADLCKGNINSSNVNISNKTQQFYAGRVFINKDSAESIDNYFTMFGYAINKIGVPNRNNRENYTYVKTLGCQISGSIPQQDLQEIVDIHDKGITYWNNPELIGNYSVSNKPRG